MERGSTSFASGYCPFLSGIDWGTKEEDNFGFQGFSSTVPSKLCVMIKNVFSE